MDVKSNTDAEFKQKAQDMELLTNLAQVAIPNTRDIKAIQAELKTLDDLCNQAYEADDFSNVPDIEARRAILMNKLVELEDANERIDVIAAPFIEKYDT
jgi:hypothetical protein